MRVAAALLLCITVRGAGLPEKLFDRLEWRLIGPFRGGRVAAVSGVIGDPTTFYFGAVGGGVWKTTNTGMTWQPIFDGQRISSIGTIVVAPSNPNVVYVGTGEADIRSQIGFGDGVYRSDDAGKTWRNVGLRDTRQIACIRVDPRDPDLVYVAALGHVYGPHPDRGVYRSRDGGRNWQKVLDRGNETGATDLALDPSNPRVIYATVWNARRTPWSRYSPVEGVGSGLFKSTDGGDHWTQIAGHGLPGSDWKRSGVAATSGRRVYLLVEAGGESGLYRSNDAGESWARMSDDKRLTERNWYFSGVTVDPKNADHVFLPNVAVLHSVDGGRSFTVLKGSPGGDDYRILWIDPTEPRRMILGSDQGTNISLDGGETWSTWYNQPTAQMYHVVTDNQFPYNVYGTQQDSGSVALPSRTDHRTIDARDFFSISAGEAGNVAIDPRDPNIFYVGDTAGALARFDRRIGQSQNISPAPQPVFEPVLDIAQLKYRFPWTPAMLFAPLDPGTLYLGAQMLLKTTDGGLNWQDVSGDLTGDPRSVIYAIAPSPVAKGTVWLGSDFGLIHLTRDDGKTWQNVTPPGLGPWSRVTAVEASHFDAAEAWASVDRHRMEDYRPYVYRTRDSGRTWTAIMAGLSEPAYVNSVREDPRRKGLLYAATELAPAISFDDGDHWQSLQLNLPTVSVRDVTVHGDDVVIATFGRGFWILDSMPVLRQIGADTAANAAVLLRPGDAVRVNPEPFFGTPVSLEEPQGKNPPDGAVIDFYLRDAGEATVEILDAMGGVVRKYDTRDAVRVRKPSKIADAWYPPETRLTGRAGMNRLVWDLHYSAHSISEDDELGRPPRGPWARPGTYTVRLTAAGRTVAQPLRVLLDPRSKASPEEVQKQYELSMAIWKDMERAMEALQRGLAPDAAARVERANKILETALVVAGSADRMPPQTAYEMAAEGKRELDGAVK
jgi:photosystem II stability/assembly factor-like uncharacterized protein